MNCKLKKFYKPKEKSMMFVCFKVDQNQSIALCKIFEKCLKLKTMNLTKLSE